MSERTRNPLRETFAVEDHDVPEPIGGAGKRGAVDGRGVATNTTMSSGKPRYGIRRRATDGKSMQK